ncbi:hypothetical protein MNR01_03705 [Lysobacter sp. S4-A87]|uniref:hypothetical protein n=1 Tax=Lysobacter sp. S4-A87 TaxID=2925843 RepID=UPI001F52F9BE|nr:hypothetical protein [Lysobacter sp. S4-A87]UNK50156.1 hypothetical protein MNR01_03705 [Lysobacter sp. S4-A87]
MSTSLMDLVTATGLFAPLNAHTTAPSIMFSMDDWRDIEYAAGTEPVHHVHRERDFGVGYGNSSGYASDRHYTSSWMPIRFGCV